MPEEPDIKPGYKSTEFWLTLLSVVISALAGLGYVTQAEADQLVGLLGPLLVAALPVVAYTLARMKVKTATAEAAGLVAQAQIMAMAQADPMPRAPLG